MEKNIVQKILEEHLVSGKVETGKEIALAIDQTLTQDATGTMSYLQFEALDIPKVKTKLSVSYIDHNTLQTSFENADDHLYLQSAAARYGIYYSRPGNGICHQVHLERFGVPGQTLLGSDSHTPTAGGMGMLAMGAGGLDVAVAMGGGPFYLSTPSVVKIHLDGELPEWAGAKDVILEVLRRLSVKGGTGKIFEYGGSGVDYLTIPERATITNMGAELGATTSIFPSDEQTKKFLATQDREEDWLELKADEGATYEEVIYVDLEEIEPLAACPHSPDNVRPVHELTGIKVNQVAIGSCTNSSYADLMQVASILRGKVIPPEVSLIISPGSRQVYLMLAKEGAIAELIASGARILESACGPCIGMGQAPPSGGVSLRTFNRNFKGRSGTQDADIYLVGPETAAVSALLGKLTDPRVLGEAVNIDLPEKFITDDRMIIPPLENPGEVEIIRGPNIKPLPLNQPMKQEVTGEVILKTGDNITTDDIMPAGAKILPLRSNIPAIAEYVYQGIDPDFACRAKEKGGGFIVGGDNYGQGSSREHAALAPMYLGIKAVIAKSFARIHHTNLVNFGIMPLIFENPEDYKEIQQGDDLEIKNITQDNLLKGQLEVLNKAKNRSFRVNHVLSPRLCDVILAGGLLNYTKKN